MSDERDETLWAVDSVGSVSDLKCETCDAGLIVSGEITGGHEPSDPTVLGSYLGEPIDHAVDVDCLACGAKYKWLLTCSEANAVRMELSDG